MCQWKGISLKQGWSKELFSISKCSEASGGVWDPTQFFKAVLPYLTWYTILSQPRCAGSLVIPQHQTICSGRCKKSWMLHYPETLVLFVFCLLVCFKKRSNEQFYVLRAWLFQNTDPCPLLHMGSCCFQGSLLIISALLGVKTEKQTFSHLMKISTRLEGGSRIHLSDYLDILSVRSSSLDVYNMFFSFILLSCKWTQQYNKQPPPHSFHSLSERQTFIIIFKV